MADKTADKYDPPSLLRASACALCASAIAKAFADKMADKTVDKYEIGGEGVALMVGHLIGFWPTR